MFDGYVGQRRGRHIDTGHTVQRPAGGDVDLVDGVLTGRQRRGHVGRAAVGQHDVGGAPAYVELERQRPGPGRHLVDGDRTAGEARAVEVAAEQPGGVVDLGANLVAAAGANQAGAAGAVPPVARAVDVTGLGQQVADAFGRVVGDGVAIDVDRRLVEGQRCHRQDAHAAAVGVQDVLRHRHLLRLIEGDGVGCAGDGVALNRRVAPDGRVGFAPDAEAARSARAGDGVVLDQVFLGLGDRRAAEQPVDRIAAEDEIDNTGVDVERSLAAGGRQRFEDVILDRQRGHVGAGGVLGDQAEAVVAGAARADRADLDAVVLDDHVIGSAGQIDVSRRQRRAGGVDADDGEAVHRHVRATDQQRVAVVRARLQGDEGHIAAVHADHRQRLVNGGAFGIGAGQHAHFAADIHHVDGPLDRLEGVRRAGAAVGRVATVDDVGVADGGAQRPVLVGEGALPRVAVGQGDVRRVNRLDRRGRRVVTGGA